MPEKAVIRKRIAIIFLTGEEMESLLKEKKARMRKTITNQKDENPMK
jgi:hypothetical protein